MVYAAFLLLVLCGDIIQIIGAQHGDCLDGSVDWLQDGYCDDGNNNENCGYDGGDCCHCTCIDGLAYECGGGDFFCLDPQSGCVDPRTEMYPNCNGEYFSYFQDGFCHDFNNNEECGYDGGDCCKCTCISGLSYDCGVNGFFCRDPSSDCIDPRIQMYPNCPDEHIPDIQDGYCNDYNNNEECGYDAGDCCKCTCINGLDWDCGENDFLCRDPKSDCVDPQIQMYPNCTDEDIPDIQDGYCHDRNNNEECGYDGGDCCECTCINELTNDCGVNGFFCRDPNSGCVDARVELYPLCTHGTIPDIGDGRCDVENNNEGCDYDGGDCCECTCVYDNCSRNSFSCLDPDVSDLKPYVCTLLPPTNASCPAAPQREWVVSDTTQARALAEAVLCPGGLFHVTWKGEVFLNETIYVTDGTVLNVTNGDANSSIIGDGKTRLFTVVNASLYLSNVVLSNGNAFYGGAVAASRSTLTFESVIFADNMAIYGGGALSLSDGTIVSLGTRAVFVKNTANGGGAIYMTGGSNISCTGNTMFSENVAISGDGGALYATDGSSVAWTARSQFLNNSAEGNGGALYLSNASSATWNEISSFSTNRAEDEGGALYLADSSSATWNAESSFFNNSADNNGGALQVSDGSVATWNAESSFSNNSAGWNGGALYLSDSSSATWNAEASFSNNNAQLDGGALELSDRSNATWNAEASFSNNNAQREGGALHLSDGSNATWKTESSFFNNSADNNGGALQVSDGSVATWNAESSFSNNSAGWNGGALYLYASSVTWTAASTFPANIARNGGALHLSSSSSATWNAESSFSNNNASWSGGALYLSDSSCATWNENSSFSNNKAEGRGGALHLYGSSATWTAASIFPANIADDGGALYLSTSSSATWNAESRFVTNRATYDGGGLRLSDSSSATWNAESSFSANRAQSDGGAVYASQANVSWNGRALFESNAAHNGGAVFVKDGATAEWTRETSFTSNYADVNGGAVGSRASFTPEQVSVITIKGATVFANNTCGGNGGGMALVHSIDVSFKRYNTIFSYNSAGVSGGAVFVTGTAFGTVFMNVVFVSNYAPTGGGVRVTESGTLISIDVENKREVNPTTFVGCKFIDNFAFGTGGAVDTASGQDFFRDTLFEGNQATVGGALRLAGTSSVVNCSFIDNASNYGGGPAVSNIGSVSTFTNVFFHGNVFNCESQAFLEFKMEDSFTVLCDGCPNTCVGCSYERKQRGPTCTSLLEAGIEHASSAGGMTTIEGLYIHKGYWRVTNSSANVNKCFNTKACSGGMTGALDFCLTGYEGPYCSICSKNYVSRLSFTCRKCSDSAVGLTIAAVATVLIAAVGLVIVSYLLSTEGSDAGLRIVARVTRRIPMQSVKIVIVVWQILTQFASVSSVNFPNVYQRLLNGVNFLNFDLTWTFSADCFLAIDFHDRLLWTTIPPIVIMVSLGGIYAVAVHRTGETPGADLSNLRHKHVSMALTVMFLVYSSASSVLFQTFACEGLDDGKRYLRADYTIECDSPKHKVFQIYASLMMLVYPLGIPAIYAVLLFNNRRMLQGENDREESLVARSTSGLWKPYKPERYYYEVIECSRRVLLTGVVVFIYPNSGAQIAAAVVIAVVFVFVSEALAPFHSLWDNWISRLGHAIVFASMYLALLLKVDVSGEDAYSQKAFEVVLVVAHGCMVLLVVIEAGVMALLLRAGVQREDLTPRRQRSSNII